MWWLLTLACTGALAPPPRARIARPHVDPFGIVRDDLKVMKLRIRDLVERTLDDPNASNGKGGKSSSSQSHPLLQEAAREFFERKERAFRPATVLLVARALGGQPESAPIPPRQCLLAEIVEMMCTAQIIHDSVLEEGELSATGNAAHRVYSANAGNKVSVLAGDFLLARCSVALSQLGDLAVVEIMATALESMVLGNVLRAQATPDELLDVAHYERRVRLKTCSLIADACRSAAILAGHDQDAPVSDAVHTFAIQLGLAYQSMDDCIAVSAALKEPDDALLAPIAYSLPLLLAAQRSTELRDLLLAPSPDTRLAEVVALVAQTEGLEQAVARARAHANAAEAALDILPDSREKDALLTMLDYVASRDQRGLQREKYIQQQAKNGKRA